MGIRDLIPTRPANLSVPIDRRGLPVEANRPGALTPYTPSEVLPPERRAPPARYQEQYAPPAPPAAPRWSLFKRKPRHPIKVSWRYEMWGSRRIIIAVFKNRSPYIYPGGKFDFRIKEGRKVMASGSHRGHETALHLVETCGDTAYFSGGCETTYTIIGSLNPGEYEERKLPGFYDANTSQTVQIDLLPN